MKTKTLLILFSILCLFAQSCKTLNKEEDSTAEIVQEKEIERPAFSSDSAFSYIEQQIKFGPRIPSTPAQKNCALYLSEKLKQFGAKTIIQETKLTIYNGKTVPCYNIIGTYNENAKNRIMLFAHWDTRPFADRDVEGNTKPNLGVDDGASGVAVLLEIARQLQIKKPEIGVDIMLFDVEDYGPPSSEEVQYLEGNYYALGTQYWCHNKHISNYKADFGILLDMVGAKNATFTYEGISMQYAASFMKDVWQNASHLGYGHYFQKRNTDPIVDDHYYVNTIANIPAIDIIYRTYETETGFAKHWHTQMDKLENIDKNTLQAVGETVLATIFNF
jgi:Zn-dependent M28 family amino/carboxypeptidase